MSPVINIACSALASAASACNSIATAASTAFAAAAAAAAAEAAEEFTPDMLGSSGCKVDQVVAVDSGCTLIENAFLNTREWLTGRARFTATSGLLIPLALFVPRRDCARADRSPERSRCALPSSRRTPRWRAYWKFGPRPQPAAARLSLSRLVRCSPEGQPAEWPWAKKTLLFLKGYRPRQAPASPPASRGPPWVAARAECTSASRWDRPHGSRSRRAAGAASYGDG